MNIKKKVFMSSTSILFFTVAVYFAASQAGVTASEPEKPGYVGTETCLGCHDGKDKGIDKTKHVLVFSKKNKNFKRGCEACHGAGGAHIDDQNNVLNFAVDADPAAGTAACLKCHRKGETKSWDTSKHAEEDLNCVNCHQIHNKTEKQMRAPQTELCGQCHQEKASEILMPGRHPVKEDKIKCADCHSPHGSADLTYEGGSLTSTCVNCHQEKAGPFRFEHEPATESCLNCHIVHGSPNKKLTEFAEPALCLQCHTGGHMFQPGAITAGKCTACHTSHHGSNLNQELLR